MQLSLHTVSEELCIRLSFQVEGNWGRELGEKGEGGIHRVGNGIPKVGGSGRNRGKLHSIQQYSQSKKSKEAGANKNRAATGIEGYRKREV